MECDVFQIMTLGILLSCLVEIGVELFFIVQVGLLHAISNWGIITSDHNQGYMDASQSLTIFKRYTMIDFVPYAWRLFCVYLKTNNTAVFNQYDTY